MPSASTNCFHILTVGVLVDLMETSRLKDISSCFTHHHKDVLNVQGGLSLADYSQDLVTFTLDCKLASFYD